MSRDEKKKMLANKTTESDWDLFDRVHAILGDINIDDVKSDFTGKYC